MFDIFVSSSALVIVVLTACVTARGAPATGHAMMMCRSCDYPLQGLSVASHCPECGACDWGAAVTRTTWTRWIHCISVVAIGPSLASCTTSTLFVVFQPPGGLTVPLVISMFPPTLLGIAALVLTRAREWNRATDLWLTSLAVAYTAGMASVAGLYWERGASSGDYGWPLTDLVVFAFLATVVICLGMLVRRCRSA